MGRFRLHALAAVGVSAWAVFVSRSAGQSENRLSAREIFYGAPPAVQRPPSPVKAAPGAKKQAPAEAAQKKPIQPGGAVAAKKSSPAPATRPASAQDAGDARLVQAAYPASNQNTYPLGVRYSVLQLTEGRLSAVEPDRTFRAGDRIKLQVEFNDAGFLYIIHRGSSGIWKLLFPSPEIAGGDNRVERGKAYEIPSGYVFTFDEQPGEEKIFLVFSRQPEADLEKLIYGLSQGAPSAPAQPQEPPAKVLLAQNVAPIEDGLVDRFRRVYARDLIIEKVDAASAPQRKENAVYVANTASGDTQRVVADIVLLHR